MKGTHSHGCLCFALTGICPQSVDLWPWEWFVRQPCFQPILRGHGLQPRHLECRRGLTAGTLDGGNTCDCVTQSHDDQRRVWARPEGVTLLSALEIWKPQPKPAYPYQRLPAKAKVSHWLDLISCSLDMIGHLRDPISVFTRGLVGRSVTGPNLFIHSSSSFGGPVQSLHKYYLVEPAASHHTPPENMQVNMRL